MLLMLPYRGNIIKVMFRIFPYENQNLGIALFTPMRDGFLPLGNLTADVDKICGLDCAFIDMGGIGSELLPWISATKLALPTGMIVRSDSAIIPKYKFDPRVLNALDKVGYARYCNGLDKWRRVRYGIGFGVD